MYRTLLATRRVLVVLDDAATESQIGPLLPGSSSCAVLVTSRGRLTALPGARRVELDVLDAPQAMELLGRVVGPERVDRRAGGRRWRWSTVGGLPLALRIVGRPAGVPGRTGAGVELVRRLANEVQRLDELAHGGMAIRASLSLTYDSLPEPTNRLLRLLSLAEGPGLSRLAGRRRC